MGRANIHEQQRQNDAFCQRCGAWRGQLGLEPRIEDYVAHIVEIFREVRRVLRKDGLCWVNLGDSYATGAGKVGECPGGGEQGARWAGFRGNHPVDPKRNPHAIPIGPMTQPNRMPIAGLKPKDLCGIPWRVALALQADGWWLRSDIVWSKPSPMPESVTDRPTRSHEYIFMLAKSEQYFFDQWAVREPSEMRSQNRYMDGRGGKDSGYAPHRKAPGMTQPDGRNIRSVWDITTQPFSMEYCAACKASCHSFDGLPKRVIEGQHGREITQYQCPCGEWDKWIGHFATFPEALVRPILLCATSKKGACAKCGQPWKRLTSKLKSGQPFPVGWDRGPGSHDKLSGRYSGKRPRGSSGNTEKKIAQGDRSRLNTHMGSSIPWEPVTVETVGWSLGCKCGGLQEGDLEVIESPTGRANGDDPSLLTGRAGYNRPRGDHEGQRPITRYEQRHYAAQLRGSPHRAAMAAQAGPAFAHYLRTDRSGARPVPGELLEQWISCGWLERVALPGAVSSETVPCLVLDPFCGSGTTSVVAQRLGLRSVSLDLKHDYCVMARNRVEDAAKNDTEREIESLEAAGQMSMFA